MAASHCQNTTNIVSRKFRRWGLSSCITYMILGEWPPSRSTAESHYAQLQGLLDKLGLQEAHDKAPPPPSQDMVWLWFRFDTLAMTVTLPPDKLTEIMDLAGL